jgi:hypothetical protein
MWEPVLDGHLADAARRMAREIALEVAGASVSAVDRTLLFAYASASIDEAFVTAAYDAALDELVSQCGTVRDAALYNDGLAGIGWVLAHVLDGDDIGVLAMIDEAMLRVVSREPWDGEYELARGLVGYGAYFLERLRSGSAPNAREGLARIVEILGATAERTADGACWFSKPEHQSASQCKHWPNGRYDCGLAHGISGAITLLARAAAIDDPPPAARGLCDDAIRWLVARQEPSTPHGGRFPGAIAPGGPIQALPAPAWCYGDLGVALALWHGGSYELARETALACTQRAHRANVADAGLCHGSTGLAHACHRFYLATGDETFRDASRTWFATTLEADRVTALHGFSDWVAQGNSYRLVNGAIGVALALLGAVSSIEPAWDRWMLCDVTRT